MTIETGDGKTKVEEPKVTPPETPTKDQDEIDFDKELKDLETGSSAETAPVAPQQGKSKEKELDQATYSFRSTAKRIKELGGDPSAIIAGEGGAQEPKAPSSEIDTSKFVTKDDMNQQEARKLAKSEGEFRVMMWWMRNKGLSVEDAHLMANKSRIKKTMSEVSRIQTTVPSRGGGGPGQDKPATPPSEIPELPLADKQRLAASGMVWDESSKAYVGKKIQQRWDATNKVWVTERVPQKK